MKKLLSILLVFLFLFSACKKQPSNKETTTKSKQESSTNKTFDSYFPDITETVINSTQSATERNVIVNITDDASNLSEDNIQNSSPIYIFIGLDELKEVKNAYNSMTADDFQAYMETDHVDTYMTGMWDYENSTALLDEMCSTYVPVLDNNPNNLSELGFYWKSNRINQLIIFDGDKRASAVIDTVNCTDPKRLQLGDEAVCLFEKTIKKDNYTAHLYEYENADYHFFADILIEDTYIILRSFNIDSIEEFEECFNRLTFVKIGDLMNE